MLITDPLFYLAAIPAVLLNGIAKGGFGGGIGILSVPIMSLVISPIHAAAILLPVLCCMDLFGLWAYRWKWDRDNLKKLLPGAIFGIIIGTLLFRYLNAEIIKLMVGFIAIVFTLHYWLIDKKKQKDHTVKANHLAGGIAGMIGGFTSFVAHSGGPPIDMYLLPQRMHRTQFVATTVFFFTVMNYTKLIPYSWLGLLDKDNLMTSIVLLPSAAIGFLAGFWLHKNISDKLFYNVCYTALFIIGIKLVLDGLSLSPF